MQAIPESLRGSYAGLASDEAIDHLKKLGVTPGAANTKQPIAAALTNEQIAAVAASLSFAM
jgi:hypothetical protein